MPRLTQSEIHSDFSAGSGTWVDYRTGVTAFYDSFPHSELNDHITREFNKKIRDLGQPESLYISPFDSGLRYTGDGNFDADASAYITLLEGDGVSVSNVQKTAIHTFFKTGKSDGWYSKLKRFYFPVWNAAAPSARCLVSGTSGTFSGTISHNAGFVTGNGVNTHFDSGSTPSAMGIVTGDALLLRGIHLDDDSVHDACGVAQSSSAQSLAMLNFQGGGQTYFRQPSNTTQAQMTGQGSYRGIYIGSSTATNSRFLLKRTTSGTTVVSNTSNDTTAIYNHNPHFLARRLPTISNRTKGSEFAWGLGNGLTQAQAEDCSLAIKTLWETVTGLTLA